MGISRPAKIFILILIALPFLMWRGFYEGPKVFAVWTLGFGLSAFWIFKVLIQKKDFLLNRTDYWFLSWLIILFLTGLTGIHPLKSILGGGYRHAGALLFFALWLIHKTVSGFPEKHKDYLYTAMAAGVLAQAILVFGQYSFGFLYFGKPLGTIGEGNALAGFLAIGTYFVFAKLDSVLYAIPVISIIITESRSGILSLLPNVLILLKNISKPLRNILFICLALFFLGFLVSVSSFKSESVVENRLTIWKIAIAEIAERPLTGYGAESGEEVFKNAFYEKGIYLEGLNVDRAHNLFLDLALWSGIPGLATFMGFLYFFLKGLKSLYKRMVVLSFLLYSLFQPLSVVHYLLLFIL